MPTRTGAHAHRRRLGRLLPTALAVLLLVAGTLLGVRAWTGGERATSSAAPSPSSSPPTEPPARVCGNRAVLDGPRRAPSDAVTVRPSDDLAALTERQPPGTTFWLTAGTHRLGGSPFDQVLPKEGNRYTGAPGAVLDGGRRNRYAFGGAARDVTVEHLTVRSFGRRGQNGNEGVVNHDSAAGWTVRAVTVERNAGAGVMLGSGNVLRDSCLRANGQYGFNAYHRDDVRDLTMTGNEIASNNTDDWERRRPGCGCTGGGKFWKVTGATVTGNWVHHNHGAGLWADTNNSGFTVAGNYVEANDGEGLFYETSYNAVVRRNTFVRNGLVAGPENPGFPTAAVFLSESGGDDRVPGPHPGRLVVEGNRFTDNWSGVVLWENADRFAGSPSNTSTGEAPRVNPGVVTADSCTRRTIDTKPYYDDCRWKTQHVRVRGNVFSHDPAALPASCTPAAGCGTNGLFSNFGTWPPWSPYQGTVVEKHVTFAQDNLFARNTYVGPWRFVVEEQGNVVSFGTWRSGPYRQDRGSSLR